MPAPIVSYLVNMRPSGCFVFVPTNPPTVPETLWGGLPVLHLFIYDSLPFFVVNVKYGNRKVRLTFTRSRHVI